eukprot:m.201465 g.201465  ORF g.201465 m.201465 type:complete len:216 (-) comp53828_c0_seq50:95-742(-)
MDLIAAVQRGQTELVRKLLRSANLAERSEWGGETALHFATFQNKLDITLLLLEAGANPLLKDKSGCTPLHYAVMHGNLPVCEALMQARASVNIRNARGESCLDVAKKNGNTGLLSKLVALDCLHVKPAVQEVNRAQPVAEQAIPDGAVLLDLTGGAVAPEAAGEEPMLPAAEHPPPTVASTNAETRTNQEQGRQEEPAIPVLDLHLDLSELVDMS